MADGRTALIVLLLCFISSGCIELRNDIFQKQPPWESKRFEGVIKYTQEQADIAEACHQVPIGYQLRNDVGLSKLARQVLKEEVIVLTPADLQPVAHRSKLYTTLTSEKDPLPESLATLDVTIALVRGVVREYERLGVAVRCEKGSARRDTDLPNTWLWQSEFKDFGRALASTLWSQTYDGVFQRPFSGSATDDKIVLLELLKAYLMEYYSGEYIDRYGVKYSKPQVQFAITNEVIVAMANIFLDGIYDYVLIDVRDRVKDPIVFEWEESKIGYLNKNNAEPTLARYLRKTLLKNETEPRNLPGVLEKAVTTGQEEGLTKREVCVVHYFSGLSGEASEGLAGLIVRSVGGANLGLPVALGKFSIGDHETVAKLIDASVETFTKRSADVLFSHVFHTIKYESNMTLVRAQQNKDIDWDWLAEHLKLSELLTCFGKKVATTDPS